ncbi:ATP-dependent DNA ligase [Nocardioides campestrisoli]|uniref:ATP-dependent DNA ligase n=1 Tax=Nocardioides campestrisoli TaxID=2736757 RepID=UPI00163D599F|nr:ATP-dependent DNA ligase [Nocardioides campestrisoli]
MLLARVVRASGEAAATRSRKAKVQALAAVLGEVEPAETEVAAAYLSGRLLQRRTGLGWRSLAVLPPPADEPSLELREVHEALERISVLAGPGSQAARAAAVESLLRRATTAEQEWLRAVLTGQVRQGALDAVLQEAVAQAAGIPVTLVRRAAMLSGSTVEVATVALREGADALDRIGLTVGRPVLPMLASSAPAVAAAMTKAAPGRAVGIDTKLDGIRIQVHRRGDDVRIWTRSLDEITARLPEVVEAVGSLAADDLVLDGEALLLGPDGRPKAFQETASRVATAGGDLQVTPYFFDVLHADGHDLLDSPASRRWQVLADLVPERHLAPRLVTDSEEEAAAFLAAALQAGHEGVVVKDPEATYAAGRRGASWVKVKPVHTLDLVVVAVEWGSGRRKGRLSNIHLAARDGDSLVLLGKTFKGMTDEMLAWQTERFTELATSPVDGSSYVVSLRPEQVVEVALDGVQRSPRYPGGVALRFARVVRYRDDKGPEEADTLETVRALLPPS